MLSLGAGQAGEAWAASDTSLTTGSAAGESVELSTNASITVVAKNARSGIAKVKAGTSYKLAPSATSGAKITTCLSSKPKVAKVTSKGVVKALKAGTTTITIKAKKGKKTAKAKVKVTVLKASKYKAVKKVTLKVGEDFADILAPGGMTFLEHSVLPAKASNHNVTFKSSNKKVLTVSHWGEVTAKKAGTAYVTVTSCANPKKSAKMKIRVVPKANGVSPKGNLALYSWAERKKIADAIAAAPSDSEGLAIAEAYNLVDDDQKLTNEYFGSAYFDTKDGEHMGARIIGFRQDTKTGGGVAGITFQCTEVNHIINPSITDEWGITTDSPTLGGWKSSEMRSWLNSDFYASLPEEVANNIVQVEKKTNNVGKAPDDYTINFDTAFVTATSDKIWLLAPAEVFKNIPCFNRKNPIEIGADELAMYKAEGMQYKAFKDMGVLDSDKGYNAVSDTFCRTPVAHASDQWCHLEGTSATKTKSDNLYGLFATQPGVEADLKPCFCF